jgi:hypothetical protein
MGFKLLDGATAIGASRAIKLPNQAGTKDHTVFSLFRSLDATKISALTISLQGSNTGDDARTGVITNPGLAIGSNAIRFANDLFYYRIKDTNYSLALNAVGSQFTAAHVIATGSKYGVIDLYVNAAGTFLSLVPLATQAYDTAADAHAAADALTYPGKAGAPGENYCYIGRILIQSNAGGSWTAKTDDMTNGSDCTTATFLSSTSSFVNILTHAYAPDEITDQRAAFSIANYPINYVRLFLSALTGTGTVDAVYHPVDSPTG